MTAIGHNTIAADQLKSIIERIERLEEEKSGLSADIKDVYADSKGNGFNNKAIKAIVKLRKISADDREEEQSILDVYLHALGMIVGDTE